MEPFVAFGRWADRTRTLIDEAGPRPGQVSEFAFGPVWNKAGADESVLQQVRDPLAVGYIGFRPGMRLMAVALATMTVNRPSSRL